MVTGALSANLAARLDHMVGLLTRLVEIESPTPVKAAVDAMGARIAEELRAIGADVRTDVQTTVGNHLVATLQPGRGRPIALVMHLDTVHPLGSVAARPVRVEDGRLYGPGACDMKASHVIALTAVRALTDLGALPDREIRFVFTSDEEMGSRTSRGLIEREAAGCALVMVMEPPLPDGRLKSARKGTGGFKLTARGRSAHAGGQYERGINAIQELAHQVLRLQALTDYRRGLTVNVGNVTGGGATNVVPDFAECAIDVRVSTVRDGEWIQRQIQTLSPVLPGASLEVTGGMNRPPFECSPERLRIIDRINALASTELGRTFDHGSTGGGSDASFTASIAPTMDGFGAVGDGMHAPDEHVVVASLAERTALAAIVIRDY